MLNVKVINFRAVNTEKAPGLKGFFDVLVGDSQDSEFSLKLSNCALKTKKADGYWWQPPGAPRLDKQTKEPVMENGYPKYDNHYDITLSKVGEKYKPTTEGIRFKEQVLEQAVAALQGGSAGRGAAPVGRPMREIPVVAKNGSGEDDDLFPNDMDDDLPF